MADKDEDLTRKDRELEDLKKYYHWNLKYEEDDRRVVEYWNGERLKRLRGLQKFYISFWKYSFPWSTLKSFVYNFNFMVIIQMIIAGLSVWACSYWNIAFNFHVSLFVSPIVFPLAFSINTDFQRREKVLHDLGDFKSAALTWFFCMREWRETAEKDKEWLVDIKRRIRSIMFMLTEYLLTEQVNRRDIYARYIYEDLSDISQLNEEIRASALPANTAIVSRIYHILNTLNSSFESLRVVREYRSPRSIRSFNKVLILLLPILLCPYFVHIGRGKDVIAWGPYALAVIVAAVFGALQSVQDKLDNPFDGLGEDDINLDTMYEWATDSLKTAAERTIIGRFNVTHTNDTNLDKEKSRSHAELIRDVLIAETSEDKRISEKVSPFISRKAKSEGDDSSEVVDINDPKSKQNEGFDDIDKADCKNRYSVHQENDRNIEIQEKKTERGFGFKKISFKLGFKRHDEVIDKREERQSPFKKKVSFKRQTGMDAESDHEICELYETAYSKNSKSTVGMIQHELDRELKKKKKKTKRRKRRKKNKHVVENKESLFVENLQTTGFNPEPKGTNTNDPSSDGKSGAQFFTTLPLTAANNSINDTAEEAFDVDDVNENGQTSRTITSTSENQSTILNANEGTSLNDIVLDDSPSLCSRSTLHLDENDTDRFVANQSGTLTQNRQTQQAESADELQEVVVHRSPQAYTAEILA